MDNNSALTNEQSSFSILPDELPAIILSYITRHIDKTSIGLVSRKWWQLSWHLATELKINFLPALMKKMLLEDFQPVLQHCSNVTALHFKSNTSYSAPESWMDSFLKLPRLSHLTVAMWETLQVSNLVRLNSFNIGCMDDKNLEELAQLTNLTHLELSYSLEESSVLAMAQLTNLVSLSLEEDVYDSGMSLFEALTNLTKLEIRESLPDDESATAITNLHNLKRFSMDKTADSAHVDILCQLTSLESISLKIPNPADLPKLLQMTNLTKLVLGDAQFDNAGWSLLAQMSKLKSLELNNCSISISANSRGFIGSLQQLQEFKIEFNDDTNVMLETIINAGIVLKSLAIRHCKLMTTSTIDLIVQLTGLETLVLYNTELDDNDIYRLTVLSDLQSLSVTNRKPMSARPFVVLTKLRNLMLAGEVKEGEIDVMQPSTMICLEKFRLNSKLKRF